MGGRCLELDGFARSCREAELALRMQKAVGGPERVTLFDDLGIYKILATAGTPRPWSGSSPSGSAR